MEFLDVNQINRVEKYKGLNMFVFNNGSVVYAPDVAIRLYEELKRIKQEPIPCMDSENMSGIRAYAIRKYGHTAAEEMFKNIAQEIKEIKNER